MESRTTKTALAVLIIGTVVWLGGANIRLLLGSYLLEPLTADFRPNIHPYVERTVFSLIAQSSFVLAIGYIVVWVCGIVYLRTTRLALRENGWLMMCAILLYLFTPVEIYTMVLDTKMWLLDVAGSNDLVEFRKLFIHRLGALAGVPYIAFLSYYTAIVLAVIRPFRRPRKLPE